MAPPVLALLGPTAAGKSRAALAVARERGDVEIVAVDAFTIYRGMDVGTAKPSRAERAEVAHHLVDVVDCSQEISVADFQQWARAAIDDVRARGRSPLLVGGSGLYWRAVVDDLRFPPTDPQLRAGIEARYRDRPRQAHARLADLDPTAAARIEPDNLRRSVRALEVIELTGRPFSAHHTGWDDHTAVYRPLTAVLLDPPADRLRAAIDRRAAHMVAAGLVSEARALRAAGALSPTAAQAIGYAEALAVADGELDEADLADRIATRTRRYARRQRSWFRRDPRLQRVETPEQAAELLART